MVRFAWLLVLAPALMGCMLEPSPSSGETGTLVVHALASPVCPVERVPPDPACEPRPVEGAVVVVTPGDGREIVVAQGETDAAGMLRLDIVAGDYLVTGSDVEGLLGRPEPVRVTVPGGDVREIELAYDTGIR